MAPVTRYLPVDVDAEGLHQALSLDVQSVQRLEGDAAPQVRGLRGNLHRTHAARHTRHVMRYTLRVIRFTYVSRYMSDVI